MYWARYVLVDQALRGRGMRSTEWPSSFDARLLMQHTLSSQNGQANRGPAVLYNSFTDLGDSKDNPDISARHHAVIIFHPH